MTAFDGAQDGSGSGEARLAEALRNLAGAGMVRFDTRAAITIILTLAVVVMAVSGHEIPKELAYPYATILGWWFPRPQEGAAR